MGNDSFTTRRFPRTIVFEPSRQWEGRDGRWATFLLGVGTPVQTVHMLPATSFSDILVTLPNSCSNSTAICISAAPFSPNGSTTWVPKGDFQIRTGAAGYAFSGRSIFGEDEVGVAIPGSNRISQTLGAVLDPLLASGMMGISMMPHFLQKGNGAEILDESITFSRALKIYEQYTSWTWSYTAGAYNMGNTSIPPSLVFGGYDASRFDKRNHSTVTSRLFQIPSPQFNVQLRGITYKDQSQNSLLSTQEPISIEIDSAISEIWLPSELCQIFEKALGLEWDTNFGLYLVNDTLHSSLLARGITITFNIADMNGTSSTAISIPYSMFVFDISIPGATFPMRYFPLKRLSHDDKDPHALHARTQPTLGRTFLQQAYLTTDYERGIFNITQAKYDVEAGPRLEIINSPLTGSSEDFLGPHNPPGNKTANPGLAVSPQSHKLEGHIISLIVVSSLCAIGIITFVIYIKRNQRPQLKTQTHVTPPRKKIDYSIDKFTKYELDTEQTIWELEQPVPELYGSLLKPPVELPGVIPIYELPAKPKRAGIKGFLRGGCKVRWADNI